MKTIINNRILIINDDPVQLRMLTTHLRRRGKEVIACSGGEEALRKLRELESVDLIITDLYMPGIDGWKLCRLLRSLEFSDFNKIPILVMSATFSGSDAEDITRELGANGFVSVPYNPEILMSTIENILLGKAEQKDLSILVVEDSDSLRGTICEGLREYGYSVFEASNGNQAFDLFEKVNPEVVILDYHLPEHNGAKLLAAFKSPQNQAAVLVTTGDANPELAMKVTQMGADAFVRKPFKIGYLVDLCEKIRREWSLLRVEKLLEDRTLELRRILDTSVDGMVIMDTSGCILRMNHAVETMLECNKDEMVGKHIWELVPLNDSDHEKAVGIIKKLKQKEKMTGIEQVWKKKDGDLFHVEWNLALLKDTEGNPTGAIASIRDITERKELEEKLLQSEKLRSLGELAGGVAHNFNNTLAVILGRTQLLGKSAETWLGKQDHVQSIDDLKKCVGIIERAALDGVDTVRRIQEFSRKRDDDKDFTRVDLNEVIDHTLEFTKVRWKDEAGPKGIKIHIEKELSCLSPIAGSGSELREVFINLINNSLDAMPQGGRIRFKTFMENSHVVVVVEDTGIGIPNGIRDRIFDPFFTTKGVQSTGLGLSASYGIINRHRGTITVDSVEGEGSIFSIKFPTFEKGMEREEKSVANEESPIRILVVEDEEDVRELLKDILVDGGYTVEVAPNGKKGIKLFQEKRCNLVFTDLGMPGMSGWQVAEEIKKMNEKTKVALVTGWEVDMNNHELKKCGVDLVIPKPFEMYQILGSVKEMMKESTLMA